MTDDFNGVDDLPEPPEVQLQRDIAERLATLSDASDTPDDIDAASSPFDASEVDFASGSWMSRLADVQGWLCLENELSVSDPGEFLTGLVSALRLDEAKSIDHSGSFPQLTIAGLDRLYERADQAVRLQRVFVEKYMEDSVTLAAATQAWHEAWEDEPDIAEPEPLQPSLRSRIPGQSMSS